jgi:hypothetical protein
MTLVSKSRRTSKHHQKRGGAHHRHSGHYLKTYWPYLPMLLIVGLGLIVNSMWSHQNVLGASSDFSSTALLSDTNAQRTNDNESSLVINQQLSAAAQAKANDMAQRNYWSHNSPDGRTPWSFITAAGYSYQAAGENLAYGFGDASDAVAGWMNSPSHRANILNANYKDVGFGVAQSLDYQGQGPETIIVAEYAAPVGSVPVAAPHGIDGAQDVNVTVTAKPVSRAQILTRGKATWSTIAVSALAGAAIMLIVIRQGLFLRKMIVDGENFVLNHPMFDIIIVFVGTMAIILAQASGTIH